MDDLKFAPNMPPGMEWVPLEWDPAGLAAHAFRRGAEVGKTFEDMNDFHTQGWLR